MLKMASKLLTSRYWAGVALVLGIAFLPVGAGAQAQNPAASVLQHAGPGAVPIEVAPAQPNEPPPPPTATASEMPAAASMVTTPNAGYQLGTGDKLRVIVYGEDSLGGDFNVDDSGYVQLPLIGQVLARGRTIEQFQNDIVAKLSDGYLKSPKVSVQVSTYRPFYIIGEVNKPGEYPYVAGMNVINAVALAGGYTYRANDSSVYIRRKGSATEDKIKSDESAEIHPGDIIRVPERFF